MLLVDAEDARVHVLRVAVGGRGELSVGERVVDVGLHRGVPDLVAEGVRVETVGEDLGREASVRRQELVREVAPEDRLADSIVEPPSRVTASCSRSS